LKIQTGLQLDVTLKSLFIDYSYYMYRLWRLEKLMANRGQFNMSIVFGRNKSFRFVMTIDKL